MFPELVLKYNHSLGGPVVPVVGPRAHCCLSVVGGWYTGMPGSCSIGAPLMASAAFSAIMMVGALRFPLTMLGIMDASTTRRFSTPSTLASGSTTAIGSVGWPILQVQEGWYALSAFCLTKASISLCDCTWLPGNSSRPRNSSKAFCAKISLDNFTHSLNSHTSSSENNRNTTKQDLTEEYRHMEHKAGSFLASFTCWKVVGLYDWMFQRVLALQL